MEKIRIGVIGGGRGMTMMNFAKHYEKVELVAICEKSEQVLEKIKRHIDMDAVTIYKDYDEFIRHSMDAVILANYATQHATFAIKALRNGLDVYSEVLPCQTLSEAVELIETVEKTGKIYAYGENYCYMPMPYEMKRLYQQGDLGEIEYAEGEYIHNCAPIWPSIAYGEANHWRNMMFSTFYCTHSIGPIIHATRLRPISVIGMESTMNTRNFNTGCKSAQFALEMITLENGAIVKSIHGGLYKNSIYYELYGSKGRIESAREDSENGGVSRVYLNVDEKEGAYPEEVFISNYIPKITELPNPMGHYGSDDVCMDNFIRKLLGDSTADVIDVYEAMDMFLPGIFAYKSILAGGISMDIPDLRIKSERDKWRNDTTCTNLEVAGSKLVDTTKNGTPKIPDEIYDKEKEKWEKLLAEDAMTAGQKESNSKS